MKLCIHCKTEKPFTDFPTKIRNRVDWCKACHNAVQYKYQRANPEKKREIARQRIARNYDFLRARKEGQLCIDCGKCWPSYVLDFHHVGVKNSSVTKLAGAGASLEKIQAEMAECILLCANCHRIRHHEGR